MFADRHQDKNKVHLDQSRQLNVNIDFAPQDIATFLYETEIPSAKIKKSIDTAVKDCIKILSPSIIYRWAKVDHIHRSFIHIICSPDKKRLALNLGQSVKILTHANEVLLAVWTIGPDLDKKIDDLHSSGKILEAYLYDNVGLFALSKTWQQVKHLAECRAVKKQWGASSMLSPGSVQGWDMKEQHILCSILEIEKFGIQINNKSVLIPFRSTAGLLGIGPGYDTKKVGSMCTACLKNKTCYNKS